MSLPSMPRFAGDGISRRLYYATVSEATGTYCSIGATSPARTAWARRHLVSAHPVIPAIGAVTPAACAAPTDEPTLDKLRRRR